MQNLGPKPVEKIRGRRRQYIQKYLERPRRHGRGKRPYCLFGEGSEGGRWPSHESDDELEQNLDRFLGLGPACTWFGVWGLGFGAEGLGLGVWGLGLRVWGFEIEVSGLGFFGLGFRV